MYLVTMFCAKYLLLFGLLKVLRIIYAQEDLTTESVPRRFTNYGSPYILSKGVGDFYTFDYECKTVGFVQGTVPDNSKYSVLTQLLEESNISYSLWIGGTNLGSSDFYPRFFYWTNNGEELTYSKWAPEYPPSNNESSCMYINPDKTFLWQTQSCFDAKVNFVCMHPFYVH